MRCKHHKFWGWISWFDEKKGFSSVFPSLLIHFLHHQLLSRAMLWGINSYIYFAIAQRVGGKLNRQILRLRKQGNWGCIRKSRSEIKVLLLYWWGTFLVFIWQGRAFRPFPLSVIFLIPGLSDVIGNKPVRCLRSDWVLPFAIGPRFCMPYRSPQVFE